MISVVSPAFENAEQVASMLASLRERSGSKGYEVLVVDDGSRDRSIEAVCEKYSATYVRLAQNKGACAARNEGARLASGENILFLDSDAVAQSDLIMEAEVALQDSVWDAAIGGPDYKSANNGIFREFWALVKAQSLPRAMGASTTFYPMIGAIRKSVFTQCGGFDEKFQGASVEDYEFSQRFAAQGWRVRFWPALRVRMHYPDWRRNLRQSFSRAAKWVLLRRLGGGFDNHTTTFVQATGMLSAASLVITTGLVLAGFLAWAWMGVALTAYFCANLYFYCYVFQHRAVMRAIIIFPLHVVLGCVVFSGACLGVYYSFLGESVRARVLYRRDA